MLKKMSLVMLLMTLTSFLALANNDGEAAAALDAQTAKVDYLALSGQSGELIIYLMLTNGTDINFDNVSITMWNPDGFSSDELKIKKESFKSDDLRSRQSFNLGELGSGGANTFWAPFQIPANEIVNLNFIIKSDGKSFVHQIKFSELNGKAVTASKVSKKISDSYTVIAQKVDRGFPSNKLNWFPIN